MDGKYCFSVHTKLHTKLGFSSENWKTSKQGYPHLPLVNYILCVHFKTTVQSEKLKNHLRHDFSVNEKFSDTGTSTI